MADWTPDFPGQRPPFTNGNRAALKSGAQSPREIQRRLPEAVEELANLLEGELPMVTKAGRVLQLEPLARLWAQYNLLVEHLDRETGGSLIDGKGQPVSCFWVLDRVMTHLRESVKQLPISPESQARVMALMTTAQGSRESTWRSAQERLRRKVLEGEDDAAEGTG